MFINYINKDINRKKNGFFMKKPNRGQPVTLKFKEHTLEMPSGISKREALFIMEPGKKELTNISLNRRKNAVYKDGKKLKRIAISAAKRLGISFEEYMLRVTEIHVHRFNPKTENEGYPYTLPGIEDISDLIKDNLLYKSKKRIIVNHNEIIDQTAGYTFLRIQKEPAEIFKKIGLNIEEFRSQYKTDKYNAIDNLEKAIDCYETEMVKRYRKRYPDLDSTYVRVHILKDLGISIRFLAETGYTFSKNTFLFNKN